MKGGISTTEVKSGVINLSDMVTMYHPEGDPTPAYRYVVDVVKLQNILFNVDLRFAGKPWDGAPLIPDSQPTRNRNARKPKDAIAELATLTDFLGLEAIISDPEGTKPNIMAEIDTGNPKRLNAVFPVNVSGNANIEGSQFICRDNSSANIEGGYIMTLRVGHDAHNARIIVSHGVISYIQVHGNLPIGNIEIGIVTRHGIGSLAFPDVHRTFIANISRYSSTKYDYEKSQVKKKNR